MPKTTPAKAKKIFTNLQSYWNLLFLVATWVMTTIGGFWVPPPADITNDNKSMTVFAKFIVSIIIGLMILPMSKWYQKKYAFSWGMIALLTLVIGITAFFTAQYLRDIWTVTDRGDVYYTGTTYTDAAVAYLKEHPQTTRKELLEDATWKPEYIWTEDSIRNCRLILASVYVLCTPLFAICMVSIVQLLYCVFKGKKQF